MNTARESFEIDLAAALTRVIVRAIRQADELDIEIGSNSLDISMSYGDGIAHASIYFDEEDDGNSQIQNNI